jgi:hypothetical protein
MKSNCKSSFTNINKTKLYDLTYKNHFQSKLTTSKNKTIMLVNKEMNMYHMKKNLCM